MAEETPDESASEETVPDLTEPFIACRAWVVNKEAPVPGDDTVYQFEGTPEPPWRLWSTAHSGVYWERGVNEATCQGFSGYKNHSLAHCSCGFYALTTWQQLFKDHPAMRPASIHNSFYVYGTVALTGLIIPGERGWRAEKAEVRSLLLPQYPARDFKQRHLLRRMLQVVRKTADTYGVPVVDKLEELSPPFIKEAEHDEHRKRIRTGDSGTATTTGTGTGPYLSWNSTGGNSQYVTLTNQTTGTSSSMNMTPTPGLVIHGTPDLGSWTWDGTNWNRNA